MPKLQGQGQDEDSDDNGVSNDHFDDSDYANSGGDAADKHSDGYG